MAPVKAKAYASPTCVLLALDWPDGKRKDFLGFAIRRKPGFRDPRTNQQAAENWLPNLIGFNGPAKKGEDLASNRHPIQKFMWWDARIDDPDRGARFTYEVFPVVGTPDHLKRLEDEAGSIEVRIQHPVENKIGTYFNRAVVSSQAFSKKFSGELEGDRLKEALTWLANGLERVIPEYLHESEEVQGAIYHLTDSMWVVPALENYNGRASLVYNRTSRDKSNDDVVEQLSNKVDFKERTRAKIMHNKFLVRRRDGDSVAVLMGSANFTTGGLTTQANLLHTFESRELAELYYQRKKLLEEDPSLGETAQQAGWSKTIEAGDAKVRVFFPPESKGERESIDAIVEAVKNAKSSVLFCLFMPTDAKLRNAVFRAGDRGLMMFGLVNTISERDPDEEPEDAGAAAKVEIYHRSRDNRDVFAHSAFAGDDRPAGFWWEEARLPGDRTQWPVFIHHKFVVIDGETSNPTVYTGSANMSKAALYNNDENMLEIKGSPRLAAIYLAEFLRLYEHYRARLAWQRLQKKGKRKDKKYSLAEDNRWCRKFYREGSPEYKARINMVGG